MTVAERQGLEKQAIDWIAADWGTTNLRVWAIAPDGAVLEARRSDRGMGGLAPEDFEGALLALAGDWIGPEGAEVLICGMAGARGGWAEAGYAAAPCAPAPAEATPAPTHDARLRVRILPGLSQSAPADVMRGEETQIAGLLAAEPDFDGALCLPGTHTKWVRLSRGQVTGFRTFLTGELFALLSSQSILRLSLDDQWNAPAFDAAVAEALAAPENVSATLFAIRAEALLATPAPGAARARLSGLLTGLELAGARPFWEAGRVALVGSAAQQAQYAPLTAQGVTLTRHDAETLTLAGLRLARAGLPPIGGARP